MCGCNNAAQNAVLEQKFGRQMVNSGYLQAYKTAVSPAYDAHFIPTNAHRPAGLERGTIGAAMVAEFKPTVPIIPQKSYHGVFPIAQQKRLVQAEPFAVPVV